MELVLMFTSMTVFVDAWKSVCYLLQPWRYDTRINIFFNDVFLLRVHILTPGYTWELIAMQLMFYVFVNL
jgi:hypothetical protein